MWSRSPLREAACVIFCITASRPWVSPPAVLTSCTSIREDTLLLKHKHQADRILGLRASYGQIFGCSRQDRPCKATKGNILLKSKCREHPLPANISNHTDHLDQLGERAAECCWVFINVWVQTLPNYWQTKLFKPHPEKNTLEASLLNFNSYPKVRAAFCEWNALNENR